ncbi:MAG: hypothetical protein EBY66_05975 [Candidatus Fonsibacter lacus]|nr:hypothetical protein [Candidatus Fonsibacter lacus]
MPRLLLLAQQHRERLVGIHQRGADLQVSADLLSAGRIGKPAGQAGDRQAIDAGDCQADGGADGAGAERIGIGDASAAPGVVHTHQRSPLRRRE